VPRPGRRLRPGDRRRQPRHRRDREVAQPERLAAVGIVGVHRIGDCYAPSFIAEAVYSGHRLAREIDSPDPSRPLPYIRERRLLDSTEADYELGSPTLSYDWPIPVRSIR
jgi:dimethylamine/trimethylamine dehydrogenase